ncbi:hypothetical protein L6452_18739 [Arctium lappa]|uniref:Uncharacterized protein n=1 Tax=Arctium lappa TaxID=4217 RepID=A0ACB9C758_ARCLA|nr:hypothetical protein L6452_18739 [Arctium lappa]
MNISPCCVKDPNGSEEADQVSNYLNRLYHRFHCDFTSSLSLVYIEAYVYDCVCGCVEELGLGKSTVFINDVAFEVADGPFNVREAFGDDAVLINSYGQPVLTNEWGVTLQSLQHGAVYYLVRSFSFDHSSTIDMAEDGHWPAENAGPMFSSSHWLYACISQAILIASSHQDTEKKFLDTCIVIRTKMVEREIYKLFNKVAVAGVSGQWLMKEKATRSWSAVKVGPVKLRLLKCLCAILPFWVVVRAAKDGQSNNKFWK